MTGNLRSFVQGTALLTVSNIALKAMNFLLLPLYTAHLKPADLGVSDAVSNVAALVFTVMVLALDAAYGAFYYDKGTSEHRDSVFNTIWFTMVWQSAIVLLLGIFARRVSITIFNTADYATAIRIALAGVMANLWYLPFALDVRIRNKMSIFAGVTLLSSLVMLLCNILFVAVYEWGYYSLISSVAIANVFQFIAYIVLAKKRIAPRYFESRLLRSMLKYSMPLLPAVLAYWIVGLSSTYILVRYSSTAQVGIYGIGTRSAGVISMLTSAVYMAYTVYAFQTVREEGAQQKFVSILNAFFVVVAGLCFMAALFGPEIIRLMVDASYASASHLLVPLMFSQLAYGISTMAGYGMAFVKKSSLTTIAVLAGAAVSLSLNFILIPRIGALGAAWSTLASYVVIAGFTVWFAERVYPCGYQIGRIAGCFGVLIVLALVGQDSVLSLKVALAAGGIVFLLATFRDILSRVGALVHRSVHR